MLQLYKTIFVEILDICIYFVVAQDISTHVLGSSVVIFPFIGKMILYFLPSNVHNYIHPVVYFLALYLALFF